MLKRFFQRVKAYLTGVCDIHSGHVRAKARFDGELILHVDCDAGRLVVAIAKAQEEIANLKENNTDEKRLEAVMGFAASIFGKEQAEKLMEYYHGDEASVMNVCGQFFSKCLRKKITDAQKKAR